MAAYRARPLDHWRWGRGSGGRRCSFPDVRAIVADRGYRGLANLAARKHLKLDIKAPPKGTKGFTPLAPLYKVEHAFARLGRWRRLSRCYEGTEASARARLEVVCVAYLLVRWRVEPT